MPNMAHHRIYKFEIEVGPSTEIEFLQLKIFIPHLAPLNFHAGLQVMLLSFPTFCEQLFASQIVNYTVTSCYTVTWFSCQIVKISVDFEFLC